MPQLLATVNTRHRLPYEAELNNLDYVCVPLSYYIAKNCDDRDTLFQNYIFSDYKIMLDPWMAQVSCGELGYYVHPFTIEKYNQATHISNIKPIIFPTRIWRYISRYHDEYTALDYKQLYKRAMKYYT